MLVRIRVRGSITPPVVNPTPESASCETVTLAFPGIGKGHGLRTAAPHEYDAHVKRGWTGGAKEHLSP